MSGDRILLDTTFVQAILNRQHRYHAAAQALMPRVREAGEAWVTEAVLLEIGNALSAISRAAAAQFIAQCYRTTPVSRPV